LVPEGRLQPGTLHTISMGVVGNAGHLPAGDPVHPRRRQGQCVGVAPREAVRVAFDYFKANSAA
jgi:ATP-dependent Lon protease